MWVLVTRRFDWKPTQNRAIVYKADMQVSVTHRCGEAILAAGAGVKIRTPTRARRAAIVKGIEKAERA
jgi:hypothetical protein